MRGLGRWGAALAALVVAAATAAQAAEPYRVRGTLVGVDGDILSVMNDDEETLEFALSDDTRMFAITPAKWSDIEPGQYVGIVSIETGIKYEGYLRQQDREVEKLRQAEARRLPEDFDYSAMPGLSREVVEKLSRIRPLSIAQASRIPGITPASISILLFHLELRRSRREPEPAA